MIRTASTQALHDMTESGERERKSMLIINSVVASPEGLTRREIEDKTGLRPNQVSGRVRELIKQKRLMEGGMRQCSITKNLVNVVRAPEGEA